MKIKNIVKSTIFAILATVMFYTVVFSAPTPGGEASFGTLPTSARPEYSPGGVFGLTAPFQTNKWYTSLVRGGALPLNMHPMNYSFMTECIELRAQGFSTTSERVSIADLYFVGLGVSIAKPNMDSSYYSVYISSYTDWTATVTRLYSSTRWYKAQIGKGLIFTYLNYSNETNPYFQYRGDWSQGSFSYYNETGNAVTLSSTTAYVSDRLLVRSRVGTNWYYFGVYAPENSKFYASANAGYGFMIEFDSSLNESQRLVSVAYIRQGNVAATEIVDEYNILYKYAYNFVTGTRADYTVDYANAKVTTQFNITLNKTRTGAGFEDGTLFALFPHQWRNLAVSPVKTIQGLFGKLKVIAGSSFTVVNNFNGIMPNLTYEVPDSAKTTLRTYLGADKGFTFSGVAANTYDTGKALGRVATLIPILHQSGDFTGRDLMISKLKTELTTWYKYSGQTQKFFGYEGNWRGIIGVSPSYGSNNYNDHNFHYGYYVYASAILAMYDSSFRAAYGGMVDLLVKDYANPVRNDADFPYMRGFDVYSGHSWASGMGGYYDINGNQSVDQESSAEAMNSWAAVYLWGLVTGNQSFIDAGVYGYTTEYSAVKEYYFDTTGENYSDFRSQGYNHNSVGVLWDKSIEYYVLWRIPYGSGSPFPQEVKGIQVLPLAPTMLYQGYDTSYAQSFFNAMSGEANNNPGYWRDIWSRFMAFYDPAGALSYLQSVTTAEAGSSLSYSYYFIHFFNSLGAIDTNYYADSPSFCVMKKAGENTFIAYNPSSSNKSVTFYSRLGGQAGTMTVPPRTFMSTKDFINFKYDSDGYIAQYITSNWNVLVTGAVSDFSANPQLVITQQPLPVENEMFNYMGPCFALSKNESSDFLSAVPMTFNYAGVTIPDGVDENTLRLAYIDPSTKNIEVIDTAPGVSKQITVNIDKAGTYIFVQPLSTPKKLKVSVYPNPYKPSRHSTGGIIFGNLKAGAKIRVYNIAGEKIYDTTIGVDGNFLWKVKNNSNNDIASGIYIYYVESGGNTYKGKMAVER